MIDQIALHQCIKQIAEFGLIRRPSKWIVEKWFNNTDLSKLGMKSSVSLSGMDQMPGVFCSSFKGL